MKKRFGQQKPKKIETKEFRINERIFAHELMVIDENGTSLGLLDRDQAMEMANERGLDLVEVSPKAQPPIAKFMNYGSFKYQKEKMEKKARAKNKTAEIKTIKISTNIGDHDLDIRSGQAVRFLGDGDKVRIELQLRGREHQHADLAKNSIKEAVDAIATKFTSGKIKYEQPVQQLGSKISAVIAADK